MPQTPLRTYIDTPLSPEPTLRLLDASGNNITHTNASARVSLSLVREVGLNDGRIEGNASTLAEYGAATFANVFFCWRYMVPPLKHVKVVPTERSKQGRVKWEPFKG